MDAAQKQAKENLDRIESTLQALLRAVEQEKTDLGQLGWGAAGELGYIASELESVESFWTQVGEEYSE